MLPNPTLDKLQTLRLHGMIKALGEQHATPDINDLSFDERLGLMVDRELTEREDARLTTRLKAARLRHNACLEDIDYRSPRGLDQALILQLGSGQWLRDGLNLIIGGPTGVGKTWLACALAHKACRDGYSVRYLRLALDGRAGHGPRRWALRETDGGLCQDRLADPGRLGLGAVYRCATARHARTAGRPLRQPLDARDQPDASGQMACTDRRSDPGRCDPRPVGTQRLSDRTEGRIDAQARNEIDDGRDFRLTMQTCVAALRLPGRMSVE